MLLAKLRSAPEGRVGDLELATRRQLVLTFVATIRTLNAQIKQLERQIATAVRAHPDGHIYATAGGRLFRLDTATKRVTVLRESDAVLLAADDAGRLYFRDHTHLWQFTP